LEDLNEIGRVLTARYLAGDLELGGHSVEISRRASNGVSYVTMFIDGEPLSQIEEAGAGRKTG
jgi:hypothetical protein